MKCINIKLHDNIYYGLHNKIHKDVMCEIPKITLLRTELEEKVYDIPQVSIFSKIESELKIIWVK